MNAGIVVYAIGMMLFTMIMGNAYAAITVMTVASATRSCWPTAQTRWSSACWL